MKLHLDINQI